MLPCQASLSSFKDARVSRVFQPPLTLSSPPSHVLSRITFVQPPAYLPLDWAHQVLSEGQSLSPPHMLTRDMLQSSTWIQEQEIVPDWLARRKSPTFSLIVTVPRSQQWPLGCPAEQPAGPLPLVRESRVGEELPHLHWPSGPPYWSKVRHLRSGPRGIFGRDTDRTVVVTHS